VRREYDRREEGCPFCSSATGEVLIKNSLSVSVRVKYPVTHWHVLVIPKRHTADYFDLETAESRACHRLVTEARSLVCKADPSVAGFNVGINGGQSRWSDRDALPYSSYPAAGGDHPKPRGGVRGVIPAKADYIGSE